MVSWQVFTFISLSGGFKQHKILLFDIEGNEVFGKVSEAAQAPLHWGRGPSLLLAAAGGSPLLCDKWKTNEPTNPASEIQMDTIMPSFLFLNTGMWPHIYLPSRFSLGSS